MSETIMFAVEPSTLQRLLLGEGSILLSPGTPLVTDDPFICYLYEEKGQYSIYSDQEEIRMGTGSGKVVALCTIEKVYYIDRQALAQDLSSLPFDPSELAVPQQKLIHALNNWKRLYGFKATNIVLYDEPKSLSDFVDSNHRILTTPPTPFCIAFLPRKATFQSTSSQLTVDKNSITTARISSQAPIQINQASVSGAPGVNLTAAIATQALRLACAELAKTSPMTKDQLFNDFVVKAAMGGTTI